MITLLILPVLFFCLVDSIELVKKKLWRELVTMGFLIGTAVFFVIAKKLNIPTPVDILQILLKPVGMLLF